MRYVLYGCPPCGARWWITDRELNPGHNCPEGYPSAGIRCDDPESTTDQAPDPEKVA